MAYKPKQSTTGLTACAEPLLVCWNARGDAVSRRWRSGTAQVWRGACVGSIALLGCGVQELPPADQPSIATTEWVAYGGDRGGQRHAALDGITPANVSSLGLAWTYRHADVSDASGSVASTSAFENTPILVNDTLYFCTPFNRVIALDPARRRALGLRSVDRSLRAVCEPVGLPRRFPLG